MFLDEVYLGRRSNPVPVEDLHSQWLKAVWNEIRLHPGVVGKRLFPTKPKGYIIATETIGNFALNTAIARESRFGGHMQTAMTYQDHADLSYKRLPAYAKDIADAIEVYDEETMAKIVPAPRDNPRPSHHRHDASRGYSEYGARHAAGEIAEDVIRHGYSEGWHGDHAEVERVGKLLKPFGIIYADELRGAWRDNPRAHSKFPLFEIQTIEVPKTFSQAEARKIAERHGGTPGGKIDESENYWRFRQHDPSEMTKRYVSLKLQHAIVVRALPKSIAKRAKISDSNKPLTQAELKRLWALQDQMRG